MHFVHCSTIPTIFARPKGGRHGSLVSTNIAEKIRSVSHAFSPFGFVEKALCGKCQPLSLKKKVDITEDIECSFKKCIVSERHCTVLKGHCKGFMQL